MGRTSRVGRSKTPAADRILWAASEMFYREGIRAVGVDAIAAEAGVTKKTLYEKFGSKDRLIAAYLRARDERWRSWLWSVGEALRGSDCSVLSMPSRSGWNARTLGVAVS